MPLPFNPAQFVTPYTGTSGAIGAGRGFADMILGFKNQKTSQGYLENTQNQTAFAQKKYGEEQVDGAHKALLSAIASGDQDQVEAAANNMRVIGARYGVTIDEERSDRAEANVAGGKTQARASQAVEQEEEPAEPEEPEAGADGNGSEPPDTTAQQEKFFRIWGQMGGGKPQAPSAPPDFDADEEAANARIDQQLQADRAQPFTGMRPPGGVLPRAPDGVVDLDEGGAPPLEIGGPMPPGGVLPRQASVAEPPGASEAPLRGYTLRGPDGKVIYQVSPKDVVSGQRQRVGAVFDGLPANAGDAGAVAEAKQIAMGLVGVLTPQQAVAKGLDHLEQGQHGRMALDTVEANRKPRFGGGGAGGGLMGKGQDISESIRYYDSAARQQAKKIFDEDSQYADMEGGLNSGDPGLQRNAINVLYKIRAGTAVSAAEDARVSGIVSMLDKYENKFRQWTGGPISPEMLNAMQQIVAMKRAINSDMQQRIYDHQAELYEAQNEGKVKDPDVLKKRSNTIRKGGRISGGGGEPDPNKEAEGL